MSQHGQTTTRQPPVLRAFAPFNKGESLIFMLCGATSGGMDDSSENSRNPSPDRQGADGVTLDEFLENFPTVKRQDAPFEF